MKYGSWNIACCDEKQVNALCRAGFSPLTARVLCSRGLGSPEAAREFLRCDRPLCDPFAFREMDWAVARIRKAILSNEKIAVYGDYDVDGITATCLLLDFLRRQGANCISYIPGRLEEGYGLNEQAIRTLQARGVRLIVTVDCGITATAEARLCRELGMDLVITDHHECKEELPACCAVVDAHRPDHTYPHQNLSGVGVAFKLASAISGDQTAVLRDYADLVCLGTIADVMHLDGENRSFVTMGLQMLNRPKRVGIVALLQECSLEPGKITAGTVGYILAPRINAAGRMGQVELATDLFLTDDPLVAAKKAAALCRLNRQRQSIETEIYQDAVARLGTGEPPASIVLAGERWHQGVVGIDASRMAKEYACPTFLICMDGDKGKASSRSYGGFNLFAGLSALSPLLEGYGGHELAAGFVIRRDCIDRFRQEMDALVKAYVASGQSKTALDVDCTVMPSLLTMGNVIALEELEPCGSGCPRPVFAIEHLYVDSCGEVGGGKHLRLRLRTDGGELLSAIFFSTTAKQAAVEKGDCIDVAFTPQINEFRGSASVQLNIVDLRPCREVRERTDCQVALYRRCHSRQPLTVQEAGYLLPERREFTAVWHYLTDSQTDGVVEDSAEALSRKISNAAGLTCSLMRTCICLDAFHELGLISMRSHPSYLQIRLTAHGQKVNLEDSGVMQYLRKCTGGR